MNSEAFWDDSRGVGLGCELVPSWEGRPDHFNPQVVAWDLVYRTVLAGGRVGLGEGPEGLEAGFVKEGGPPPIVCGLVEETLLRGSVHRCHDDRRLQWGRVVQQVMGKALRGHGGVTYITSRKNQASTMMFRPGLTLSTDLHTTIRYGITLLAVPVLV